MNQIVKLGDQLCQIAQLVGYPQTGAKLFDQLYASRAVTMMTRPELFWRQSFPEVVAQGSETYVALG